MIFNYGAANAIPISIQQEFISFSNGPMYYLHSTYNWIAIISVFEIVFFYGGNVGVSRAVVI